MKRCTKLFLTLALLIALFGCSVSTDLPGTSKEPSGLKQTPGQTARNPNAPYNPLTGLKDGVSDAKVHRMPISIMINNIKASLPQYGISKADIIYEMLAEGNITRLLAIFQDPSQVERIGSIRSARPYYMEIAQGYRAVYLHFGGSVPAYSKISKHDIINLDGIQSIWDGTLYYRDAERKKTYPLEHTVFTTGQRIEKALTLLKRDLTVSNPKSAFSFSESHSARSGKDANKIDIRYSKNTNPWFEYDQSTKTYLRFQFGKPHMDAEYNEQIRVKNVFILKMKTTSVKKNPLHLIEIDTTGTGSGYYACDGKYFPIIWKKRSATSPILFYLSNGSELKVSPGKTFICCIPLTLEPTFTASAT
ncbi:MAG: DUF3048 domain-containing protein [Clostridiales bacterium]|nr:DUF3048 domain-containing protein [Clostridiales bacterium]